MQNRCVLITGCSGGGKSTLLSELEDAEGEFLRLERDLPALGYEAIIVPKASVNVRADFVLSTLAA